MNRQLALLTVVAVLCMGCDTQNDSEVHLLISGQVRVQPSFEPLEGATVEFTAQAGRDDLFQRTATTDANGRYSLNVTLQRSQCSDLLYLSIHHPDPLEHFRSETIEPSCAEEQTYDVTLQRIESSD